MKRKNKKLKRMLLIIIVLSVINILFGHSNHGFFNLIIAGGLFLAILLGIYSLIQVFKKSGKIETDSMPYLTKEKEDHYLQIGMTTQEIVFFRETMAEAKANIATLDRNMGQVAKLKAINLRHDTVKAAKAMFKEIVKEPKKLHHADRFLYNHLPNIVELTNKFIEINNHELKNKNTYDALNKSSLAIEEVSQLIVHDYDEFVSDDLDELDVEISIAKQNMSREHERTSYKEKKELD